MSVQSSDIKFYLTGASSDAGAQADPNLALGDYRSSTEVVDAVEENLYDNVSNTERISGDTEYRCFCIKNTNGIDSLENAVIWIATDTGNGEDDISFAVEVPNGGDISGYAQSVANESTAPTVGSGNVSAWSDAVTKGAGVPLNQGTHDVNLDANEIVYVWLRRIISVGASPVIDTVEIKIEGDI